MEELRKEYEGLNLSDEQIVTAKSLGLTLENIKELQKAFANIAVWFNQTYNQLLIILRNIAESDSFKDLARQLDDAQDMKQPLIKRNKKGKPLKSWQKNSFYE